MNTYANELACNIYIHSIKTFFFLIYRKIMHENQYGFSYHKMKKRNKSRRQL